MRYVPFDLLNVALRDGPFSVPAHQRSITSYEFSDTHNRQEYGATGPLGFQVSNKRKQFVVGVPVVLAFGFFPSRFQRIRATYSNPACAGSDLENLAVIQRRLAETAIHCAETTRNIFFSRTFSAPLRCKTVQPNVALAFVQETCSQYWSRAVIGLSRRRD
jgi:hypothetical protein